MRLLLAGLFVGACAILLVALAPQLGTLPPAVGGVLTGGIFVALRFFTFRLFNKPGTC